VTFVIDASMAIAWVFPEQQTPTSREVLRRVAAEGAFASAIWRLEVANVLRGAIRRKQCGEKFAVDSIALLTRLKIATDEETDAHAWGRTRDLSNEFDLTVYDAAYLELALRRQATLATLDRKLADAGRRAGVGVLCD
jgi:predicted nucleic acid-binding protein